MAITPIELQQQTIPRRFFRGYNRVAVDELLDRVATSFELIWRERSDLTQRVQQLEGDLTRTVEVEGTLRSTMISAERTAQAHRDKAFQEAEQILDEAHARARAVMHGAREEKEQLGFTARELVALLRSALATLEMAAALSSDQPSTEQRPAVTESGVSLRDPNELGMVKKLAG